MTALPGRHRMAVGLLVLAAGVAGYAIGSWTAVGRSEADRAREAGFRVAHGQAAEHAWKATRKRGFEAGLKRGRTAGEQIGMREGARFGGGETVLDSLADETAAAQASASAARAEIAARQPNCGAVARAPDWCPTADELAGFRAAVRAAHEAGSGKDKGGDR